MLGTTWIPGRMLKFLQKEEQDVAWKLAIYKVPRGVMAWAARAATTWG